LKKPSSAKELGFFYLIKPKTKQLSKNNFLLKQDPTRFNSVNPQNKHRKMKQENKQHNTKPIKANLLPFQAKEFKIVSTNTQTI